MAKYSGWGFDKSFIADVSCSANQYYFMTGASTAGKVKVATGGSNPIAIGVLQNKPRAGEEAVVRLLGSTKVRASWTSGSNINYGTLITSNSAGLAIAAGGVAANPAQGYSIDSALTAGGTGGSAVFIEIVLTPLATVISASAF